MTVINTLLVVQCLVTPMAANVEIWVHSLMKRTKIKVLVNKKCKTFTILFTHLFLVWLIHTCVVKNVLIFKSAWEINVIHINGKMLVKYNAWNTWTGPSKWKDITKFQRKLGLQIKKKKSKRVQTIMKLLIEVSAEHTRKRTIYIRKYSFKYVCALFPYSNLLSLFMCYRK